jgi:hypothetical protein
MTNLTDIPEFNNNSASNFYKIHTLLSKCCLYNCNDIKLIEEYQTKEKELLNDIIKTNNINNYNMKILNMRKEFYKNDIYRDYIKCKITNCYPLTELYLNYMINNTPQLNNYKKENEKFTVDDYINIQTEYNFYSSSK